VNDRETEIQFALMAEAEELEAEFGELSGRSDALYREMLLSIADRLNVAPHEVAPDLFEPEPSVVWKLRRVARRLRAFSEEARREG